MPIRPRRSGRPHFTGPTAQPVRRAAPWRQILSPSRWITPWLAGLSATAIGLTSTGAALAATEATASTAMASPIQRSDMDETLFKQSLAAEMLATKGDFRSGSQIYLEAARRLENPQLYQRATEMAIRGGQGEMAYAAAKAWRNNFPQSREANEFAAQILLAMGRSVELAPTLRSLIQLTPLPSQPQVMLGLPRSLARLADKAQAAKVIDDATQPWRQAPLETPEAWLASAEAWMLAKDGDRAMASLKRAEELKPEHQHLGLVAIDLMGLNPEAEAMVQRQLARADAPMLVRMAYGRKLAATQRFEEAAPLLQQVVDAQPDNWGHRVTLAAVQLELKRTAAAEATLRPLIKAADAAPPATADGQGTAGDSAPAEFEQAYLLMAQIAEQRQQPNEAVTWLTKADPQQTKLNIQGQRARLLARQGQLDKARAVIKALPETEPRDAVAKAQAETQLLRDAKQWREAYQVMQAAVQRFPEDSELLYDLSMLAERMQRYDDMEQQLREVIRMAPDNANAYNALGYSLADRGTRLPEARELIQKALNLKPGDPFITDSLAWLEYRAGNLAEATRLLKDAYASRPDPEIAAHLGELLWVQGQKDAALKTWRDAQQAEPDNDALKDTLRRLKVKL